MPETAVPRPPQIRNMLVLLGFPADRILVEDRAYSTVQNAACSVPLAKQADTSGIILVTPTTHRIGPTETSSIPAPISWRR